MKTQIKIFTALLLALTTMPVLAATCPYDEINQTTVPGKHPKCDCSDTGGKGAVPATSLGLTKKTHFISYNYQADKGINQCDEWIYLDAPCVHKGHSPSPKDYQTANIQQKGNCLVFGKQHKRERIRQLVAEYNKIYDKGNGSIQAGDKILIADTKTVSDPVDLVDEWTAINKYQKKSGQPTIRGILWGYNKLCEKNGVEFELVRSDENGAVYYVCQGTKHEDISKIDSKNTTPGEVKADSSNFKTQTTQQQTNTVATSDSGNGTGNAGARAGSTGKNTNTGSGNVDAGSDDGVELKRVDNPNADSIYIAFSGSENTADRTVLHKLADTYNTDVYKYQNGLGIGNNRIVFKWDDRKTSRNLKTSPVFEKLKENYTYLCNKNIKTDNNVNGITKMNFSVQGAKGICNITECNGTTYKKQPVQDHCDLKPQTPTPDDNPTPQKQPTQEEINQTIRKFQETVRLGKTIQYPATHADNRNVQEAIRGWEQRCKDAVNKAKGVNDKEGDYIVVSSYNEKTNTLQCIIKKCKNGKTPIKEGRECPPDDPEPTTEWTLGDIPPTLGNHINVPTNYLKDSDVQKWIKAATAAIADAGGTNPVTIDASGGDTTYTCIITTCKNGKDPINNGTACPPDDPEPTVVITEEDIQNQPSENDTKTEPTVEPDPETTVVITEEDIKNQPSENDTKTEPTVEPDPETIDSLKAETQGIDVASGPSANVELKQPTQEKICANQYPSDKMGQACCKAGGKWNTEKQICTCPKQSSGYFFDKQKLQCVLDDDTDEEEIEEPSVEPTAKTPTPTNGSEDICKSEEAKQQINAIQQAIKNVAPDYSIIIHEPYYEQCVSEEDKIAWLNACFNLKKPGYEYVSFTLNETTVDGIKTSKCEATRCKYLYQKLENGKCFCADPNTRWDPSTEKCICDTSKGYKKQSIGEVGTCECDDEKGFVLNEGKCVQKQEIPKTKYYGIVMDEKTKKPLVGVNISQGGVGTITDYEGKFVYTTSNPFVTFSYTGYKPLQNQRLQPSEPGENVIYYMEEETQNIDEVTSQGNESEFSRKCKASGGNITEIDADSIDYMPNNKDSDFFNMPDADVRKFYCDCTKSGKVYNEATKECEAPKEQTQNLANEVDKIIAVYNKKAKELREGNCKPE